jgi:carbamoyltransferase
MKFRETILIILGISCFYHDSAACLLADGRIISAAQEERFTRIRHDQGFPSKAVEYCLREAGCAAGDIDLVAFYEKPFIKFERILETYLAFAPRGILSFMQAMPLWLREKLWLPDLIRKNLGTEAPLVFPEHHESHAASAFFPSPFEEAAFLTLDGVGEWTTASYGTGAGNRIEILAELRFPHSLGLLYSAFTYYTGFKVNSGEYKVMGLAPYGEPRYADAIRKHLIDIRDDGSFRMNMDYFNYGAGLTMTNGKFDELFGGPPRIPETELTQKEMDIARSIQDVTEEVMLKMARHVRARTGMKNCCFAGGVALNCVGNGKIRGEKIFDRIWIQPAAGDAGGSAGAALFAWHQVLGNERRVTPGRDAMRGSFLGPEFGDEEIGRFLKEGNVPHERIDSEDILLDRVADCLIQEKVVGWFQGRMEFGPRALGARSILGDARSPRMQAVLNSKIKFRESFRPFAPSVLDEYKSEWFELDVESPYMLLTADVVPGKRIQVKDEEKEIRGLGLLRVPRSQVPAVTHVDFSARVQTVDRETNPVYHSLIRKFHQKTGCPILINTSFNVRGEPMVCTPGEAYDCFMRTHMDYLVLGRFFLSKENQPEFIDRSGRRDKAILD